MGNVIPPYNSIYKLSENELKILKNHFNENLEKEYIQRSINLAGAPILFVLTKDVEFHLYVNYRGFNKITVKNRYLFFLMGEILHRLSGTAIYTKPDLKDIYYKIRIRKRDE
jgi:hypothetical protein